MICDIVQSCVIIAMLQRPHRDIRREFMDRAFVMMYAHLLPRSSNEIEKVTQL